MHKFLLSSAIAGTFAMATLPASAMPGVEPLSLASAQPSVTLVSGGCGFFRHRAWNGFCYPNGGPVYAYGYGYGYHPYGWYHPWGWHHWHHW